MPTKKNKRLAHINQKLRPSFPSRIAFVFLLVGIICFLVTFFTIQKNSPRDTRENQVKNLPNSIKNELTKTPATATFRVPILMYHYVEYVKDTKDTIRQSLNINPYIFEEQIKTLKNAGYTFMTAGDLGSALDGKNKLPKNPIILTFDDGHWDLETDVLPILKKYNVRATAYIVPGFIGQSDSLSHEQLKKVVKSNLVEIGAHTVHHLWLKEVFLPIAVHEIKESKTMLEATYGVKVVSFAYPYGAFDPQAIKIVKESGFTNAVSTVPGIAQSSANKYFLYRLRPGGRTGEELLSWLRQNIFRPYN